MRQVGQFFCTKFSSPSRVAADLLRGFMHTIVLNYSAKNIAVLDLSTSTASDQLRLLGAFGISNLETGVVLILLARGKNRLSHGGREHARGGRHGLD